MFFPKCYRSPSHYDSDVSGVTPVGLSIVQKSTRGTVYLLPWALSCAHSLMSQLYSPCRLQRVWQEPSTFYCWHPWQLTIPLWKIHSTCNSVSWGKRLWLRSGVIGIVHLRVAWYPLRHPHEQWKQQKEADGIRNAWQRQENPFV